MFKRFCTGDCVAAIQSCATELGHMPTAEEYRDWAFGADDRPSITTVVEKLDPGAPESQSWRAAIAACGVVAPVKPRTRRPPVKMTPGFRCTNALEKCAAAHAGEVPSTTAYDRWRKRTEVSDKTSRLPTSTTIRIVLDPEGHKWGNALRSAGLDPRKMMASARVSESLAQAAKCLEALRLFSREHTGKLPSLRGYTAWARQKNGSTPSREAILTALDPVTRSWRNVVTKVDAPSISDASSEAEGAN